MAQVRGKSEILCHEWREQQCSVQEAELSHLLQWMGYVVEKQLFIKFSNYLYAKKPPRLQ